MKKYSILALTLVLTAALFTGCGCTNRDAEYTTAPTTMPSIATTAPTTEAATMPTTAATESTTDRGNGPLDDNTTGSTNATGTTEETMEGRARQVLPNTR